MTKIGPRLQRYLQTKRDPSGSLHAFMGSIERTAEQIARATIEKMVGANRDALQKEFTKAMEAELSKFPKRLRAIEEEFGKALKLKIDTLPHLKGESGKDGKDGRDGKDAEDPYQPLADVDYPSIRSVEALIANAQDTIYRRLKNEGFSASQVKAEIQKAFTDLSRKGTSVVAAIARGLEALTGNARLSYGALRNTPDVHSGIRHTLHRGGGTGKQTYYYDLSDLCDGVTKVFAIPSNTRVVSVVGTDSPAGAYRPAVDWTGSGTTSLTLTAAVAAPTRGATLYIIYVV